MLSAAKARMRATLEARQDQIFQQTLKSLEERIKHQCDLGHTYLHLSSVFWMDDNDPIRQRLEDTLTKHGYIIKPYEPVAETDVQGWPNCPYKTLHWG